MHSNHDFCEKEYQNECEIARLDLNGIQGYESFPLTGQNFVKTNISPLGSTACLASRVSITIDLAGNHDFA